MTNAAGILQYCVKNNVLSANGAEGVKDQLLSKLGITSTENAKSQDYQQGPGRLAADRRRQEPGSEQPGHLADHREGEAKSLRSGAETGQILYFMMNERRSAPPFFLHKLEK